MMAKDVSIIRIPKMAVNLRKCVLFIVLILIFM